MPRPGLMNRVLVRVLGEGWLGTDGIAAEHGCSSRTIQRRCRTGVVTGNDVLESAVSGMSTAEKLELVRIFAEEIGVDALVLPGGAADGIRQVANNSIHLVRLLGDGGRV